MYRPQLITPPAEPIVSTAAAMRQCRIDADALDATALAEVTALLDGYVAAATEKLDGWGGELGRCLQTQTWRQDFDRFQRCMRLPIGPVQSITSVTYKTSGGAVTTVDAASYNLVTDGGGRSFCQFLTSFSTPGDLHEFAPVSITFVAGEDEPPKRAVQAILLALGAWYENREDTVIGVSVGSLPTSISFDGLISTLRKGGL